MEQPKGRIDLNAIKDQKVASDAFESKDLPEETLDKWLSEYTDDPRAIANFKEFKSKFIDGHKVTESEMKAVIKYHIESFLALPWPDPVSPEPTALEVTTEVIPSLSFIEDAEPFDYRYRENPLLEYVCKVADIIHPDTTIDEWFPSHDPNHFAIRYFNKDIDESRKEEYANDADLMENLKILRLDPAKFWYFILYVRDYVDGLTKYEVKLSQTPSYEVENIIKAIKAAGIDDINNVLGSKRLIDAKLVIGDDEIKITKPQTLWWLKFSVEYLQEVFYLKEDQTDDIPDERLHDWEVGKEINAFLHTPTVVGEPDDMPQNHQLFHFRKLLDYLVAPLELDQELLASKTKTKGRPKNWKGNDLLAKATYYAGFGDETWLNRDTFHKKLKVSEDELIRNIRFSTHYRF